MRRVKSPSGGPAGPHARAREFTWSSKQLLQVVEQSEALLIGDGGEGVVGVHLLQAGHQVCQRVVDSEGLHLRGRRGQVSTSPAPGTSRNFKEP